MYTNTDRWIDNQTKKQGEKNKQTTDMQMPKNTTNEKQ